ncbi:MAG: hypothetical protein WC657_05375 [Candidatus Paceibacterota bacterium]|jgi:hypothetical protein
MGNNFRLLKIRFLLLFLLFANFAIASFADELLMDEDHADLSGKAKGTEEFNDENRVNEDNADGNDPIVQINPADLKEHDTKDVDDSRESRMNQIEVETVKDGNGGSITKVKKDSFKLRVICFVNQKMIEEITRLIREKEVYLFDRIIPPISFNIGTRFESGLFETDNGTISAGRYPPVSASLSIPLYQPEKDSQTQERKQLFLGKMFDSLRDLEYLQRNIVMLREKRMVTLKVIETTGPTKLDTYYQTEQEILKSISEINKIIRFIEASLGVNMLELYEKAKY